MTSVAITKLDVLDTLDEIKICVGYKYKGKLYEEMPSELAVLEKGMPQYITMPGWKQTTIGIKKYDDLPKKARAYVEKLCKLCGVKPSIISTGAAPGRDHHPRAAVSRRQRSGRSSISRSRAEN